MPPWGGATLSPPGPPSPFILFAREAVSREAEPCAQESKGRGTQTLATAITFAGFLLPGPWPGACEASHSPLGDIQILISNRKEAGL